MPFVFSDNNTFCISLLSKPDRWEKMKKRFDVLSMKVTRWAASTSAIDKFGDRLRPGEIGCAQSHVNIWRYMVQQNLEYALIFEDDACLDKDWVNKLALLKLPEEWDLVLLNACDPIEPRDTWVLVTEQYLTAGYILSLKGAQRLLHDFAHCFYSSDWMTTRLQNYGQSYSYFPWLCIQENAESCIGNAVDANRKKVVDSLAKINYDLANYVE